MQLLELIGEDGELGEELIGEDGELGEELLDDGELPQADEK